MKKLSILLLILLTFTACGDFHAVRSSFIMDTVVTWDINRVGADALIDAAEALAQSYESQLSAHIKSSAVYAFNDAGEITMTQDMAEIVRTALAVADATDGAYDITVAPLVTAWDVAHADDGWTPPTDDEITALLPLVGWENLTQNNLHLKAVNGADIDLGGIGKGYTLGACAEMLASQGASGTISFGGNIAIIGKKSDGSDWRVGIKNPNAPDTLCGVLTLPSGIVAVSGGYERYAEHNGRIYHHIIDPDTGYPSDSDVISAAVWVEITDAKSGALADALSTALFVMGSERAIELYDARIFDFEYVLVLADGSIVTSENITERFAEE